MPDIGWMELLVIGIVALIVVGPKDLPMMFRRFGQFTGRIRAMAKDFQRAMDDAAEESGMSDLKRDLSNVSKYTNPKKMGMDALNDVFDDIDPTKYEEGSETRKMAEQKAAEQKTWRDAATARRRDRDAAIIAEKNAATQTQTSQSDTRLENDGAHQPDARAVAADTIPDPGVVEPIPRHVGTDQT